MYQTLNRITVHDKWTVPFVDAFGKFCSAS